MVNMVGAMSTFEALNQEFIETAKRLGLNPLLLREIISLNARGYNNRQIASMTGLSRQTVAKYLNKVQNLNPPDFWGTLFLVCLVLGGIYLLDKYLKEPTE